MSWIGMKKTRRWEETSKEEEKTAKCKMKGQRLQVEGAQRTPELLVSKVFTKEKEQKKEKKTSKLVGWSTEKTEEKESKQEFEDAEDMVQWRTINQEEIDSVWKKLSEKRGRSAGEVQSGGQQERSIQRKR